jgi:large subunit ribosomal protein L14
MIQMQTKLQTMDNSGANIVQCIKSLGGSFKKVSHSGEYIVLSIKTLRLIRKVRAGEVHFGLVTRTKKKKKFKDGTVSNFNNNSIILLNKKKKILGTRIFGPISRNLRRKKFLRILLLCGKKIY